MVPILSKNKFRKVKEFGRTFFGPWPIYPLQITIAFTMASSLAGIKVAQSQNLLFLAYWRAEIVPTLIFIASVFLILTAAKKFMSLPISKFSRQIRYLFVISLSGILFQVIQNLYIATTPRASALLTIRNIMALFILSALFGQNYKKLEMEIAQKSEALLQLEAQRELIIEADEKARREVANFLHDNVQANLVVLAIELRKIASVVDPPHNQEINSVIEEIDDLRALDVRQASRKLSPDIATIGLAATLEELFLDYREALDISLAITVASIPNNLGLCIYRITEQTLLNAALHGRASKCSVKLAQESNNDFVLSVSNNGLPVPEFRTSGTGSAVIESWVQKFDGRWTLESSSGETVLTAKFPVTNQ